MILVGDKIKLIKAMPDGFKGIGRVFIIKNINDGVITFYDNDTVAGCMSYDEFEKYFEKIEKKEWSGWNTQAESFTSPITNKYCSMNIRVRDNGKKVQLRCCGYKAEATCCNGDTFDFDKGYELAKRRLIAKIISGQVESFAKTL